MKHALELITALLLAPLAGSAATLAQKPVEPVCLTACPQANDQLLYFTSTSLLADDKHLVVLSDRTGHPNVFLRDLTTGRDRQLTFNTQGFLKSYVYFDGQPYRGFGRASVSVDPQRGVIYFIQGRQICAVDTHGTSRVLAELPAGQMTAFTHVSADGTRLCVPTTDARALDGDTPLKGKPNYDIDARIQQENLASYLHVYDTAAGKELSRERVPKAWITHVQFSPRDQHLILYNHEWPSDCGIRRMWLWDGHRHFRLRSEGNGRSRADWTCHEMWERDGSAIVYHGGYAGGPSYIGRVKPDGSGLVEIALPVAWKRYGHFTVGRPGWLVTDGCYEQAGDPRGAGAWISVVHVDWGAQRYDWQPLCRHGSSWKSQDEHPHPVFNHAADAVCFTSDRSGKRAVYRVQVPGTLVAPAALEVKTDLEELVGQPADIAPSAYQYRADRKSEENPPESWIGLMKYARLPFDKAVDLNAPALKRVLCGLIWEEVRRVRHVALAWDGAAQRRPKPDEVVLTCFDAEARGNIPTWWNPAVLREAGKPEVSADGLTYTFAIPVDTFGLVVSVRGQEDASAYEVPTVRAFVPERWKRMDLEIQWGFDKAAAASDYSGRIEAYDGIVNRVRPLAGDAGTTMRAADQWRSAPVGGGRRGVSLSLLYLGTLKSRKLWPYNAELEDTARTIITLWTSAGNFSFLASDLEKGPILAPEYGFFVRVCTASPGSPISVESNARTAQEFVKELAAKGLKTTRRRVREHSEQTWEGAVAAMFPGVTLPAIPKPEFETPMKVEVPCERLSAQWNLGAWHLVRHAVKNDKGQLRFNDHPYGILASETHLVLHALDLMGMHKEAADGLDQWLGLPLQNGKPVGLFADGDGCLTHAVGPPGAGGNMDGIHAMGPGAIMFALVEHFRLTGDGEWLRANAPRMKANVEWILRQRRLLARIVPGGDRLWCKGLQPAHQVTPDSGGQLMQFYESEAYYWLAVRRFAGILMQIDPAEGQRLTAEAESYRKDLKAAVERSIALSPVVLVRDGTYRSFIPFACYVRGFASGAWSWRRPGSGAHVGGLYWDTIQSAEPLVSPAGLLPPEDRRVQGGLDVLEDRLLLENPKVAQRTPGYDPKRHWFAHAAWQYQPGLERHANIHLAADDVPNFLRSWLNQYAVLLLPNEGYTFREHTTGGPPDKIFEEAAFLERFRDMLVMEEGDCLWLARATPRAWLEQGKTIRVQNAPTHFGTVACRIVSSADDGKIKATVSMPSRGGQKAVLLRFRHPTAAPIRRVTVNGQAWEQFDKDREVIRLEHLTGTVAVEATY